MSGARSERLHVVAAELIAQDPLGGVAWDYLRHVLGFQPLGFEVHDLGDTGQGTCYRQAGGTASRPGRTVTYLRLLMERFCLEDRWAYRLPWNAQWFGLEETKRSDVVPTADLIVNASGTLARPERYRGEGGSSTSTPIRCSPRSSWKPVAPTSGSTRYRVGSHGARKELVVR